MQDTTNVPVCSFCGQKIVYPKRVIRQDFDGPNICEDCVKQCYETLYEKKAFHGGRKKSGKICPEKIKEELDRYVIGQDDAKIALAIAVYNHYKMLNIHSDVKISKSNILLIGPTGSGKTLLAKTIAELLDVPFAIGDCTSLTEAGYVGDDVETVLLKLINAANGDVEKAERGIVFLDEVDKLARANVGTELTKDPSGEGVQQALLKLIEGTTANVAPHGGRKNPMEQCIEVNTENILFICGGAFPGLEEIINKRTGGTAKKLGFGADVEKKDEPIGNILKKVETEDLVKYGMIPEFIGRVPVIVSLDSLDEDALKDILEKPRDSIIRQYRELMKYDGVDLIFTEKAMREIARETIKKNTGARGLRTIIEGILREPMYRIPSDRTVKRCIVNGLKDVRMERESKCNAAC